MDRRILQKPRIDFEVLAKYKEGIIVSSACPSGIIAKSIELGELGMAKKYIKWFKEQFGDDYYLEVMPHNDDSINRNILLLADEFKVKPIVTPDCHHVDPSQKEIQELKLILNTYSNKIQKDATYEKSKSKGT